MPSDDKRLKEAFWHIKDGTYPAIVGRDDKYRIEERPWNDMPVVDRGRGGREG